MIRVSVCSNDERGSEQGWMESAQLKDHRGFDINVVGPRLTCRFFTAGTENGSRVRIGRRLWLFAGYRPHVGNLLWDAVSMTRGEGLRLLRYLFERGWRSEGGTVDGPFAKLESDFQSAAKAGG